MPSELAKCPRSAQLTRSWEHPIRVDMISNPKCQRLIVRMLSSHFCKETVTYYSGNPLDRVSYLREDEDFLVSAREHPTARFLPLHNLLPRIVETSEGKDFGYMSYEQVKHNLSSSACIFLGIDRSQPGISHPKASGVPYWAIALDSVDKDDTYRDIRFGVKISRFSAAIYAQARHTLDWVTRNKFCASCGSRTGPDTAGYHLICTNSECATKKGISNISFPRTDNSIIVAVLDFKGENILLGRGKRFPPGMYSCLAGFLEPGESVEDCVRREVFEEAGVKVGHVTIHSSQPWPYPANIMMGCLAQIADSSPESHKIHLEHDPELADAQWVPIAKVQELCAQRGKMEGDMFIPPPQAIAWVLLDQLSRLGTPKV